MGRGSTIIGIRACSNCSWKDNSIPEWVGGDGTWLTEQWAWQYDHYLTSILVNEVAKNVQALQKDILVEVLQGKNDANGSRVARHCDQHQHRI